MEKYRVTTDALKRFNKGDEVYDLDWSCPGPWVAFSIVGKHIDKDVVERNPGWFEKVEQEFGDGQWLYHVDDDGFEWLFKYRGRDNNLYRGACAINLNNGYYYESYKNSKGKEIRPATSEEIEQALTREARRRGFGEGVKIEQDHSRHDTKKTWTLSSDDFWYDSYEDALCVKAKNNAAVWVYIYDEWAEIIEEDEPIIINEYVVKFRETGNVDVGCKTFYDPHSVFGVLNSFIKKWDITISRKGEDITEQIKEIAKRLK